MWISLSLLFSLSGVRRIYVLTSVLVFQLRRFVEWAIDLDHWYVESFSLHLSCSLTTPFSFTVETGLLTSFASVTVLVFVCLLPFPTEFDET